MQAAPDFNNMPTEFLYGMNFFDKQQYKIEYIIAPRGEKRKGFTKLSWFLEFPFARITKIGLPSEIYSLYKEKLNQADYIICINDQISLGILFWKLFGKLKKQTVFCIIMSLPERIKYFRWCWPIRWFINAMLKQATTILTLSNFVQKDFINDFKLDSKKVKTFYFGTDLNFWKPMPEISKQNFILSIGNDMNRDYQTLIEALPENIHLKIITKKKIDIQNKNIEILSDISDEKLRELYNQCLFVVIPSIKLKNESSGLSCALQAMACKKPILISYAPPMAELFENNKHCIFYDASNREALRKKIITLYSDNDFQNQLAENAFNHVQRFSNIKMAAQLDELIRLLP